MGKAFHQLKYRFSKGDIFQITMTENIGSITMPGIQANAGNTLPNTIAFYNRITVYGSPKSGSSMFRGKYLSTNRKTMELSNTWSLKHFDVQLTTKAGILAVYLSWYMCASSKPHVSFLCVWRTGAYHIPIWVASVQDQTHTMYLVPTCRYPISNILNRIAGSDR